MSGEYAAARPLLERAVRSWERRAPGGPGLADRLSALAQILLATGDRLRARELAERAAAMTEARGGSPSARAQGVLADVLESEGKLVEARPLRERAVAIQEKAYGGNFPWVAEANNDFADILVATGDHATARSHYERALSIGRRLSAPEQVWRATLGLGRIHERDGLLAEAVGHYRTAMTTVEGLAAQFARQESRRQYLETNQRLAVYDALARALLRLHELEPRKGYDREAAGILDAKRARIAAEALTAVRPTPPDPQVRAALDQIRAREDQALALEGGLRQEQAKPLDQQDTRRIQELTVLLAQTKSEYLDKVRDLIERSPRSRTLVLHSHSVDPRLLAKFADRLPAGTLAVQYFAAADALYIFLVGPGGLFQVKKHAVTQTALYALIEEYRAHVALGARSFLSWSDDGSPVYRREVTRFKQVTLDLGRHLLGPIERELESHRDLVLIPNDALLYLPIHALGRPSSDEQIRFLAETHTVSYATQLEIVDVLGPAGAARFDPSWPWATRTADCRGRATRSEPSSDSGRP
jgi:tetratricopeptide (TPR) repeat protein